MSKKREFSRGIRDSIPIAVGYFSVSFSFGVLAASHGLSAWIAGLISLTNVTSAGQFAGLTVIVTGATLAEMALTQLIINLRYALMSLSLSQKLKGVGTFKRCLIAFANTDEIFAVAMMHQGTLTPMYMAGLESLPILGWTGGTVVGAVANNLLPASVSTALGVALYGMFIAIVVPAAKRTRPVLLVVLLSITASCLLRYVPFLHAHVTSGMAIIVCTLLASAAGAAFFPVPDEEEAL